MMKVLLVNGSPHEQGCTYLYESEELRRMKKSNERDKPSCKI